MTTKKLSCRALGNKKRSYRQKKFLFSTFNFSGNSGVEMTYDAVEKSLLKLKELGLDQVESGWAHHASGQYALEICEREGIDFIWQDTSLFGGFQKRIHRETTEEEVKKVVEDTKHYKCLKGYYVWDEPWFDYDMNAAREQTDWFDKYAPGKNAFTVTVPNANGTFTWENGMYPTFTERFLDTIEPPVASFDHYPFGNDEYVMEYSEPQLDNSTVWKDMGVMRRAAIARDLPFWYYFATLRVTFRGFPKHTFPMTRVQINYALMYGVKCLQAYGLCGSLASPDKLDEERRVLKSDFSEGCFFDEMKAIIFSTKNLGKTFFALHSDHVYHGKEVLPSDAYFNENFRESIADCDVFALDELPFRCSIGELSDDHGNRYFAILNRDYEFARSFTLPLSKKYRIYEVSKADGKHYPINDSTDCLYLTLEPGDMAFYRIEDPSAEPSNIEYFVED